MGVQRGAHCVHDEREGSMTSPSWKYCSSIYLPKEHCTLYRDEALGVQLQIMMKRGWSIIPPKEKCYYFIDGVDGVFRSEDELVLALEKRNAARRVHPLATDRKRVPSAIERPQAVAQGALAAR
jgi:hypothetical protein